MIRLNKVMTVLSIAASVASVSAMAAGPWRGGGDGAAAGVFAGLEAALLTTLTANNAQYDAQTLQVQAAAYEDSRVKGAVFEAFANQVAAQMGAPAQQIDQETFDMMVAQELVGN